MLAEHLAPRDGGIAGELSPKRQRDGDNSHSAPAYGGCRTLAKRCSASDAAERQNVLALAQNETQQSIGKAALAERCIAAA